MKSRQIKKLELQNKAVTAVVERKTWKTLRILNKWRTLKLRNFTLPGRSRGNPPNSSSLLYHQS